MLKERDWICNSTVDGEKAIGLRVSVADVISVALSFEARERQSSVQH